MQDLISKYGGEKHLQIPDELKQVIDPHDVEVQNEIQVLAPKEFAIPDLKIIPKKPVSSRGLTGITTKYDEDIHENGHSSVWGSYWHPILGWGYQCCYSFDKQKICRGEEGKVETIKKEYELEHAAKMAKEEQEKIRIQQLNSQFISKQQEEDLHVSSSSSSSDSESDKSSGNSSDSSGPRRKRKEKLKRKRYSSSESEESEKDERKRKFNSLKANDAKVTDKELEEFQRKRQHFDDPMRK